LLSEGPFFLTDTSATSSRPAVSKGGALARAAGVAGAATMASRILGVVREQVLAAYFGAGNAMDAYNIAFRIPNLVRDLFAEGAMSAAFVPTFTRRLTIEGKNSAWQLGNTVLTALLIITVAIVAAGIIFARPLVTAFAGDYAAVPGKLELTILLTRIMLPFLTLVALAAAFMGMLNSLHRFFLPALSPAMFNVGTIVCTLALVPLMPSVGFPPIAAVAIGTVVGGFGQLAIQWPALRREGFRYRPVIDFRDEGLRRVLLLMGPGTIGLAATQVNVFVNTVLAAAEGTGAVSWLNYAFRLMYLPIGLFGVSIATAAMPTVSRYAAAEDRGAVRRTVADSLALMMMLNVPATVGLMVLAVPIVQIIFERRAFTHADTLATAAALQFYAAGLLGYSVVRIASPTFYALNDSRSPVTVSILTVLVNAGLNIALARVMGYRGLALGTSIAALLNGGALLFLLDRRLHGIERRRVLVSFGKIAIASAMMGGAAVLADLLLMQAMPGSGLWIQLIRLAASIAASIGVLALSAHLLHIDEFRRGVRFISSKLARGRS
jgi:putative peptidoglycan lipid II flippase